MLRKIENNEAINLRLTESVDKKSIKKEIEELLKSEDKSEGVKMLLEEMLSFLAKFPTDQYHDYRNFRHLGLRNYLINRFLHEKWNENLGRSSL